MNALLKKTFLFEKHKALGAEIVDFSGWEMPIKYKGILDEHKAVRENVGIFDTCHMGELLLKGNGAAETLQYLIPRNVEKFKTGRCYYSHFCNFEGNILDDLVVYKIADEEYFLVVNSAASDSDYLWVKSHLTDDCEIENLSNQIGKIDVQGPSSRDLVNDILEQGQNVQALSFYSFSKYKYHGDEIIISRTGYTGELGFEIYANAELIVEIWDKLLEVGSKFGCAPAGLGARDALRLEAGFPLMGMDMSPDVSLIEAGFEKLIDFEKENFIGKDALLEILSKPERKYRIGFIIPKGGIARVHCRVLDIQKNYVGEVLSGTYSPSLKYAIGFAFVNKNLSPGDKLLFDIRGKHIEGQVVNPPFIQLRMMK
mgnify:CR=1 FL=1